MDSKDDERSVNWAPDQIKQIWERIHQLHGIIGEWEFEFGDDEPNTMAEGLDAIQRGVRRLTAAESTHRRQIKEIHRTISGLDQGTNERFASMQFLIDELIKRAEIAEVRTSDIQRRLANVETYYVTESGFGDLIRRVRSLEEKVRWIQESGGEAQRGIERTIEAIAEEVAGMKPYTELDFRVKAIEDGLSAYGVPFKGPGFTPKLECPGDGCQGCTGCQDDKIPQFGAPWAKDEPFIESLKTERPGGVVQDHPHGSLDQHMPGAGHSVWRCRHVDCVNTRQRLE